RQHLPVALRELAWLAEPRRRCLLGSLANPREPDLEQEEFVEGKSPPGRLGVLGRTRPVQRDERVEAKRQPLTRTQRGRQGVAEVTRRGERALDQRAQPSRGHLLARGIDRREVRCGGGAVEVVRANVKLVPPQLSAQAQPCPGLELVRQPRLVEPDGRDLAALVADR